MPPLLHALPTNPPSCYSCSKSYLSTVSFHLPFSYVLDTTLIGLQFNDLAAAPLGSAIVPNPPPTPYSGLKYTNFAVL